MYYSGLYLQNETIGWLLRFIYGTNFKMRISDVDNGGCVRRFIINNIAYKEFDNNGSLIRIYPIEYKIYWLLKYIGLNYDYLKIYANNIKSQYWNSYPVLEITYQDDPKYIEDSDSINYYNIKFNLLSDKYNYYKSANQLSDISNALIHNDAPIVFGKVILAFDEESDDDIPTDIDEE